MSGRISSVLLTMVALLIAMGLIGTGLLLKIAAGMFTALFLAAR